MTDQHPITPPPELLSKWEDEILKRYENVDVQLLNAYQAGADAELEACCGWIESLCGLDGLMTSTKFRCEVSDRLRAARRPKPPSLKEQALETLSRISKDEYPCSYQDDKDWETIRRALETLDD